ncbi:MAG: hypothetical protein MI806_27250 [Minwuiales bacterium]|nr:hypothetical protein [Minwuiales bacterium]
MTLTTETAAGLVPAATPRTQPMETKRIRILRNTRVYRQPVAIGDVIDVEGHVAENLRLIKKAEYAPDAALFYHAWAGAEAQAGDTAQPETNAPDGEKDGGDKTGGKKSAADKDA